MAAEWTADKIYDRCAYLNCYNGKYSTGHKLFRFPAYNDSRHNLWIRYTGNVRLRTWASATIRRAGICADHFGRESFVDETRQSLRRHAVPKPYSATDAQAKPSSTLLAHIKSLPRKQTRSRKITESEDAQRELEGRSSEADEPLSAPEKPMPVEARVVSAVKTLRKVRRIKIERQILNSDKTVILERCKNPETCPASRRAAQEGGKPPPHFHKVHANNAEQTETSTSGTRKEPSNARKSYGGADGKSSSGSEQRKDDDSLQKSREDTENAELRDGETTKVADKPSFQMERYHINLSKALPITEESSTTSRYSGDPEHKGLMTQAIQDARAEPARPSEVVQKKHPSTTESIKKHYKSREEISYDRCAYRNCKKGRISSGDHLFRFPQSSDPRLKTWIKNAGNTRMLYWSSSTIRRAGLCGDHFTKDSFFNTTHQRLLRTAVPKPFYLETSLSANDKQAKILSRDDLLKIFHTIENRCDAGKLSEPAPIDLPSEKSENRENTKIRYPFENPELTEINNVAETSNSASGNVNEASSESFVSVMVKPEPMDQTEVDDPDEMLSTTPELTYSKDKLIEETEEDPLKDGDSTEENNASVMNDNEEDSAEVNNVREIVALQQQKARLCKIIKQFSAKLKDAKIHKNKLRSQLLAYSDLKMH